MRSRTQPDLGGRGRGRPVGSDSAETRTAILRAAREVINERGYEAATFQAIAQRAGFSRPTMHYYFHTKEQVYDNLLEGAKPIVVSGDFTGERVRSELYRAFRVDGYVEGVGRFDSLDKAARPAA